MAERSEIDRIRDSAGSMTVGDDTDGSITGSIVIADQLHIIKQKAIYRIAMADQIDPDRTRADIPNTQQLVLRAGSESEIVRRILLTAAELFRADRLLESIDWNAALVSALEILKDVISAQEIADEFEALKADAERELKEPEGGAFRIPAITGLESRTKSLIQKLDHALQGIFGMCSVFIAEQEMRAAGKWLDGFAAVVAHQFPSPGEPFPKFSAALADFGKLVRNIRHCIEHKKPEQRISVKDYSLTADRTLQGPTIQVIHPATPIDQMPLDQFMRDLIAQLIDGTEGLMAYLAASYVKPLGGFPIFVGPLPNEQSDGPTLGYLVLMGDKYVKLG